MKITLSSLIYNLVVNALVCLALGIAGTALAGFSSFAWPSFLLNLGVSYLLAMAVGLSVPFVRVGRWFTHLFGVRNDTYTHNLPYRLLASFIGSLIFFSILSPTLFFLNFFLAGAADFLPRFLTYLTTVPVLFAVDYLSSLMFDIPGYRLAKKVDPAF